MLAGFLLPSCTHFETVRWDHKPNQQASVVVLPRKNDSPIPAERRHVTADGCRGNTLAWPAAPEKEPMVGHRAGAWLEQGGNVVKNHRQRW